MINLHATKLTAGENRVYFALWAVMKSPLLLSANLPELGASLVALANNTELIAVNQDDLGVQARKLSVDGAPLPWLVALAHLTSKYHLPLYEPQPASGGQAYHGHRTKSCAQAPTG